MPKLRLHQQLIKECRNCGRWSARLRGEDRLEDWRCAACQVWMVARDPEQWLAQALKDDRTI